MYPGSGGVAAILVENREIHQGIHPGRLCLTAPFVEGQCLVLFAHQIKVVREFEERVEVRRVRVGGLAELRDRADPIAARFQLQTSRVKLRRGRAVAFAGIRHADDRVEGIVGHTVDCSKKKCLM